MPLSTQNAACTSRVPALPEHLQRHELADAIAKGSLRNQGCDINCVTKTQTPSLQMPKVSGSRPRGRADSSWCREMHKNHLPLPQTTHMCSREGSAPRGMIWLPGGVCSKQNSQQRLQGFCWSIYGLKCAETLAQHMKGGSWVNVNAEQPPTQADISSGIGGPDPD